MSHLTIQVAKDEVTAEFARIRNEAARPRAICAAAGRAMANYLKKHFRRLETENPNQLKGPRTHFWLQIGRSVQNPEVSDESVSVTVSDPRYAHKVYGGDIRAKRVKFLTIPVTSEAYGRSASTFEAETGKKLVAIGYQDRGVLAVVNSDGSISVQYVLRSSVHQDPFPGALPDMDAMAADALQHARNAANRKIAKP